MMIKWLYINVSTFYTLSPYTLAQCCQILKMTPQTTTPPPSTKCNESQNKLFLTQWLLFLHFLLVKNLLSTQMRRILVLKELVRTSADSCRGCAMLSRMDDSLDLILLSPTSYTDWRRQFNTELAFNTDPLHLTFMISLSLSL